MEEVEVGNTTDEIAGERPHGGDTRLPLDLESNCCDGCQLELLAMLSTAWIALTVSISCGVRQRHVLAGWRMRWLGKASIMAFSQVPRPPLLVC